MKIIIRYLLRALISSVIRVTYGRKAQRLEQMASLGESSHPKNRIHDGQDWLNKSHPLPTSQSGQDQL